MKFIVNGTEKTVSLKVWNNKENRLAYGGADIFADLAGDSIRADNDFAWSEDDECYTCSEQTYDNMVTWWTEEVSKYNLREPSWFTDGMDEDEFMDEIWLDHEYFFEYD